MTPGRKPATRGNTAAPRSGRRPRSTPTSACSTFRPATPHRTSTGPPVQETTSSPARIVAIDAATGKYRWHFQEVHHDIWDYDAPSPVVLFNAAVNGQLVQGLGEPGKTGWEYLLDRKTGKPLYGITEKPVPQSSSGQEHTSATQPFPNSGAFVPHTVSAAGLKAVRQAARATLSASGTAPKIVPAPVFTPPS